MSRRASLSRAVLCATLACVGGILAPALAATPGPASAPALAATPGPASAPALAATPGPASCAAPSSKGAAVGEKIADPSCDYDYVTDTYTGMFGPLLSFSGKPISATYVGVIDDAAYRIEVPNDWNGKLVLYAHPYRGIGNVVWVDSPQLRSWFIAHGFAWAASSFGANDYDVGQGVTDTHDLLGLFKARTRKAPKSVFLEGESMGGEVASVAAEEYKKTFAGVMDSCAPISATGLYDYYLGVNVTAAELTKTAISFPAQPSLGSVLQYETSVATHVLPGLGSGFLTPAGPSPADLTAAGKEWETALSYLSGGPRSGFDSAFAYWNSTSYGPLTGMPTLFDLYPGLVGGTVGSSGNVATNLGVVYKADSSAATTSANRALNAGVLRVKATATSVGGSLPGIPAVQGDPDIPVLALYGTGDLFVPLSVGQAYAQAMAAHGQSGFFVARAIRDVSHCGFTEAELSQGFSDLVSWVSTGVRAAGDDITDPKVVDSPGFACRFTDGPHPLFHGPPCPK